MQMPHWKKKNWHFYDC